MKYHYTFTTMAKDVKQVEYLFIAGGNAKKNKWYADTLKTANF